MTSALATIDEIDVNCECPSIGGDHSALTHWFDRQKQLDYATVTKSASGWQEDVEIDPEIDRPVDKSIVALWDVTSDYHKVLAALKDFRFSNRPLPKKEQVLARITELNDFLAEDPEEPELNAASVGACLRFLWVNNELRFPDIMASPNGTIVCQWRKDKHRNLTVEFLPDRSLHYVVFAPAPTETIRISGRCSMTDFLRLIRPLNTEQWTTINAR